MQQNKNGFLWINQKRRKKKRPNNNIHIWPFRSGNEELMEHHQSKENHLQNKKEKIKIEKEHVICITIKH